MYKRQGSWFRVFHPGYLSDLMDDDDHNSDVWINQTNTNQQIPKYQHLSPLQF